MRQWVVFLLIIFIASGAWFVLRSKKTSGATYQTGTVTKGTLVVSVAASGQMNSNNRVPITTALSGTVSGVLVKEGDAVTAGKPIMRVTLDATGQLADDKALANLLSAQNALSAAQQAVTSTTNDVTNAQNSITTAQQAKTSLHRDLLNAQSAVLAAQSEYDNVVNTNASSTTIEQKKLARNAAKDAQTIAQSKYDNADTAISQAKNAVTLAKQKATSAKQSVAIAQTNLTIAQQTNAQAGGTITAPVSGVIGDLTYMAGMVLANSLSSSAAANSSSSNNSTQVATVMTATLPTGSFSLAETDVPKVQNGQKVTLTLDALSGKTFTGTVVGVNRTGTVTSGVASYPMTVQLDAVSPDILPNMSATANVITFTKENVLMVSSAAVKTSNGTSTATILDNGQPSIVTVEAGISSDSSTEIISGLTEGQTVVTASSSSSSTNSGSVFGGGLRIGGGNIGGAARSLGR